LEPGAHKKRGGKLEKGVRKNFFEQKKRKRRRRSVRENGGGMRKKKEKVSQADWGGVCGSGENRSKEEGGRNIAMEKKKKPKSKSRDAHKPGEEEVDLQPRQLVNQNEPPSLEYLSQEVDRKVRERKQRDRHFTLQAFVLQWREGSCREGKKTGFKRWKKKEGKFAGEGEVNAARPTARKGDGVAGGFGKAARSAAPQIGTESSKGRKGEELFLRRGKKSEIMREKSTVALWKVESNGPSS